MAFDQNKKCPALIEWLAADLVCPSIGESQAVCLTTERRQSLECQWNRLPSAANWLSRSQSFRPRRLAKAAENCQATAIQATSLKNFDSASTPRVGKARTRRIWVLSARLRETSTLDGVEVINYRGSNQLWGRSEKTEREVIDRPSRCNGRGRPVRPLWEADPPPLSHRL